MRNREGYADRTAGNAIRNVAMEKREREHRNIQRVIRMLRELARHEGYEVQGSIFLRRIRK